MKMFRVAPIAVALAMFASFHTPAFSQSDETAYCEALVEQYTKHKRRFFRGFISDILGNNRTPIVVTPDVEAKAHCQHSPEIGIALLERVMRDAGLELPPQQAERK